MTLARMPQRAAAPESPTQVDQVTQAVAEAKPQTRPRALVELTRVTRRYGRLVALRDFSLRIEPGEFVFVIGPSEAGKTTLLKLIHGDLRPNRGTIRVDRHQLHRRRRGFLTRLRRDVAAVFQDQRLLPDMTARGNVTFALQVADLGMPRMEVRERADARLHEVGLGGRPGAFPHQLSGGQQRRLAIARALGHDPVLLLADEPTANLDRVNAERVLDLLEHRCRAGTTVVVATHDLELALARPHRVVELREGRIMADRPARAPLPGNGSAAAMLAARHQAQRGMGVRLGEAMQLVLGYTPPPLPIRSRPPRPGVRVRAEKLSRLVLAYTPLPAVRPRPRGAKTGGGKTGRGAWSPPREVVERLASNSSLTVTANGHANGNGHAPGSLAPLALTAPANGHAAANGNGLAKAPARPTSRLGGLLDRVAPLVPRREPRPPAAPGTPGWLRRHVSALAQLVLGYTPPPRRARPEPGRPRRWPWTAVVNLVRLSVGGAVGSWLRNFGTAAPALGSISLLLLLAGTISVSGFAARSLLVSQESEASVLHVYLTDDAAADQTQVDQLHQSLVALPHVRTAAFVSKAQALAQAQQRPGLGDLASLSDSNPFPAGFTVQVDNPANVGAVAKAATSGQGVDTNRPTSYDAGTYDRLRQFTIVGAAIAGGFALLVLAITYAISSNAIRAAVLARKDELLTMQLVGASPWLLRARLAVEGALTGGLSGVLAAAVVLGACLAAYYGERHLFVQVLPGVTTIAAAEVMAGIVVLGLAIGSVAALFSFRRIRA
jgi:cell division transport system ATP-binding protein